MTSIIGQLLDFSRVRTPNRTAVDVRNLATQTLSLLESLCQHAFAPRFLTSHRHREEDILMWDNPTTMHKASPIGQATGTDDSRVIWRISLKGTPSVFPECREAEEA